MCDRKRETKNPVARQVRLRMNHRRNSQFPELIPEGFLLLARGWEGLKREPHHADLQKTEGFTYNPTGYWHYKSHFRSRINFLLNENALSQMDPFQEEDEAGTSLKSKMIFWYIPGWRSSEQSAECRCWHVQVCPQRSTPGRTHRVSLPNNKLKKDGKLLINTCKSFHCSLRYRQRVNKRHASSVERAAASGRCRRSWNSGSKGCSPEETGRQAPAELSSAHIPATALQSNPEPTGLDSGVLHMTEIMERNYPKEVVSKPKANT